MAEVRKVVWRGGTQLAPVPVVLVSCGDGKRKPRNLVTVAWCGIVCSEPPQLSIALRPERYSYGIIRELGEFVVNVPRASMAAAVDSCGVVSGRTVDKFARYGLTPQPSSAVATPLVAEAPINLECKVGKFIELGSHDLFIGRIVAVDVDAELVDAEGAFDAERADLLGYTHGHYRRLGEDLGGFGFSVRKAAK